MARSSSSRTACGGWRERQHHEGPRADAAASGCTRCSRHRARWSGRRSTGRRSSSSSSCRCSPSPASRARRSRRWRSRCMLALAGAFILSLTFVPAMVALLIRGKVAEKEVKADRLGQGALRAGARRVIARPWPWIGARRWHVRRCGSGLHHARAASSSRTLDEGNLAMQALRIPSTSLEQSTRDAASRSRRRSRRLPEVAFVYLEDRHGRGRQRSDAAERLGRLHHPQAAGRMARRASTPRTT